MVGERERERERAMEGRKQQVEVGRGPGSAGCHFFYSVSLLSQELSVKYYFKPDLIRENGPFDKRADESLWDWGPDGYGKDMGLGGEVGAGSSHQSGVRSPGPQGGRLLEREKESE